jgi:hypothetical protein
MSTPSSPLQLLSGKTPWYPTHDSALSSGANYAFRRTFDNIYQIAGTLLPLGVSATGMGTVIVPADPKPPATVPSCQITLTRVGLWLVTGVFSIKVLAAGDLGKAFSGSLFVQGLQLPPGQSVVPSPAQLAKAVLLVQAQPETHTISQTWAIRVRANATARLQIQSANGALGTTSLVDAANSSIIAVWCGL